MVGLSTDGDRCCWSGARPARRGDEADPLPGLGMPDHRALSWEPDRGHVCSARGRPLLPCRPLKWGLPPLSPLHPGVGCVSPSLLFPLQTLPPSPIKALNLEPHAQCPPGGLSSLLQASKPPAPLWDPDGNPARWRGVWNILLQRRLVSPVRPQRAHLRGGQAMLLGSLTPRICVRAELQSLKGQPPGAPVLW